MKDTVAGYLLMAGAERRLSETVTVGVRLQWKSFEAFESDAYGPASLRGHEPNLRLDGSEPVFGWSRTDDMDRVSILFTLRYARPLRSSR